MEPMGDIEIVTPEEFVGDVIGDLNARRGRVSEMDGRNDVQTVRGIIPVRETFGYATDLRSLTQGRASYSMEVASFEPLPKELSDRIVGVTEY